MTEPSPLGRAALDYARSGWAVFPCKPRGKEPLTSHGLKDATTNLDVIRRWWTQHPDANIGLNCGKSGLMVIDLDKRADADGLAEWERLLAEYQLDPHTAASRTGGGGRHLLFRVPPGVTIRNSASRLAPGIDVRGEGGYIVLPPSVHPSGPLYCWESETEIEPVPEVVVQILTTEPDPWQAYTLKDAFAPRPPLVWLVDKVVPAGSLNVWFGAPGSLKSMVLAELALCVAAGRPWLSDPQGKGGYATRAAPVLWLDFDNGKRRTHERFQALAKAHRVALNTPLTYYSLPEPPLDAGDAAGMGRLGQRVVDHEAGLVVIDNLGLIKGAADENSDEMQTPMKNLRWLAETTGAAVAVIHHQRKSNGYNTRAGETLRGHSSIESALDMAVHVDRDGQTLVIGSTKDRGFPLERFGAEFSFESDERHELVTARFWPWNPDSKVDETQAQLEADILAYVGKFPNVSATQIYNHLGGNRKNLFDTLRALKELGQIAEKQGPGTSRLLYVP